MLHATHFICFASTTALQSSVFTAFADNRLGVLFGGLHLDSVSDVSYASWSLSALPDAPPGGLR